MLYVRNRKVVDVRSREGGVRKLVAGLGLMVRRRFVVHSRPGAVCATNLCLARYPLNRKAPASCGRSQTVPLDGALLGAGIPIERRSRSIGIKTGPRCGTLLPTGERRRNDSTLLYHRAVAGNVTDQMADRKRQVPALGQVMADEEMRKVGKKANARLAVV